MFINKQSTGCRRQYPPNFSQQGDVLGVRDVMKNTSSEGNIEDTRFYGKAPSFEEHIARQLSESTLCHLETSSRDVGADDVARRKIPPVKWNRVPHSTAKVED